MLVLNWKELSQLQTLVGSRFMNTSFLDLGGQEFHAVDKGYCPWNNLNKEIVIKNRKTVEMMLSYIALNQETCSHTTRLTIRSTSVSVSSGFCKFEFYTLQQVKY